MLSKNQKLQLRKHPGFFDQAEKVFHSLFTLFYLKDQNNFLPTVIVPKKAARKATERNHLKRVVYVGIEKHLDQLKNTKLEVAIVLKAKATALPEKELQQAIITALLQL